MIHAPTLLLIDIQPEYYTKSVQKAFPNFIEQITKLLAIARKHKFRIIHIREKYDMTKTNTSSSSPRKNSFTKWQTLYRQMNTQCPTIVSGNPLPCARALPHEPVVIKPAFDAFMGTRLHTMLQTPKKKTLHNQVLWIAGVMTSICVHHTANGALARGYDVHVVVDGCVDRTRARHNTVIALYKNYIWKTIRLSQFTHSSSLNTGRGQQRNVHRKRKTKKSNISTTANTRRI